MQLPDDAVQFYLDEIDRTGRIYAAAKAKSKAMEKIVGICEATLMKVMQVAGERSVAAQKRDARAHPSYLSVVRQWEQAIEDETTSETENENAKRTWESWRTLCANERAIR